MRRPPFRLLPRPDESLYSILARWSRYLGDPPRAHFEGAIFGSRVNLYDDLPVGFGRLVENGWLDRDVGTAVGDLTVFRYYAAGASRRRREAGIASMTGEGDWPHRALGSWRPEAIPAERLRFCPECLGDMLASHPDPWWRRAHQLPTVLVCPEHQVPLRESVVSRKMRKAGYVAATPAVCPPDSPQTVVASDGRALSQLAWLASRSRLLLVDGDEVSLADVGSMLAVRLHASTTPDELHRSRAADRVLAHWHRVLELRPDWNAALKGTRWLSAVLDGEEGPPLHRLLVEGAIEQA